jgi:hypothetical protein
MPYDTVDTMVRDAPVFHEGGVTNWNALPETLRAIQTHARPGTRTLETGCGASTVVFAASGSTHTTISPDSREHERVRAYCTEKGIDTSSVTFIDGLSDDILPRMGRGLELDFVFIDGAHSFPFPVVDFHYAARSLTVGGRILLDDVAIPAVAPIYRFMNAEPYWCLEALPDDRAALFQLNTTPPPEEYRLQAFNRSLDYGFLPLPDRVRLDGLHKWGQAKRSLSARYPRVRSMYDRLARSRR